jgi:dTMP kinase
VIEGLDGSGKGTQTELLIKYLKEKNIPFEFIKSPDYRTPVGEAYRKYLNEEIDMETDAVFLLVASDVMMNKPIIEAARKEGKVIIAERYITATIASQCANGFSFEKAIKFVELMEYPKPDLIIFIDVKPETGMKRKREQGKLDRHEKNLEFLRKVREFYLKEIEESVLGKWVVVNGEKSIEEVHEEILKIVKDYLIKRKGR